MNIKNLFGYTRWIAEVCEHPDHKRYKARNEQRIAALKATNSLTENERTRAYFTPYEFADAITGVRPSGIIGNFLPISNALADMVNCSGRSNL